MDQNLGQSVEQIPTRTAIKLYTESIHPKIARSRDISYPTQMRSEEILIQNLLEESYDDLAELKFDD